MAPRPASNALCAAVRLSAGIWWTHLPIAHCTTYSSRMPAPPTCQKYQFGSQVHHETFTLCATRESRLSMNRYASMPPAMDAPAAQLSEKARPGEGRGERGARTDGKLQKAV